MEKTLGVVLKPVYDSETGDSTLEPNFVRVRASNSSQVVLNNDSLPDDKNCCYAVNRLSAPLNRVRRVSLSYLSFVNLTYNVNPYNNEFIIMLDNTTRYTITLTPGVYTPIQRWTAVGVALQALVAGLNYTVTADVNIASLITFTITNHVYKIVGGTAVTRGLYFWGINTNNSGVNIASSNAFIFPIALINNYTRYVDVCSFELTQYTKLPNVGEGTPPDLVKRWAVEDTYPLGRMLWNQASTLTWCNYNPTKALASIDISIKDEFGNFYYVPQVAWPSFYFSVYINCET